MLMVVKSLTILAPPLLPSRPCLHLSLGPLLNATFFVAFFLRPTNWVFSPVRILSRGAGCSTFWPGSIW